MSTPREIMSSPAYRYAEDVLGGKILAPKTIRQQAKHFLDDLRRAEGGTWRYRFDLEAGRRPVRFCEQFLRPTAGDYEKFEFMPWQEFVDCQAFGWIDTHRDVRRYREVLEMVGRGNGKTARMSGKMGYMTTKGSDYGSENYFAANSGKQARRGYMDFYGQMMMSPVLKRQLKLRRAETTYEPNFSRVTYIPNDPASLDGLRPYFVVKDELEAEVTFDQINQLLRPMKKRRQPMMWYTMTAGTVLDGPAVHHYVYAKKILDRDPELTEREIDLYLPIIYEIDPELPYDDPGNWIMANPSIGHLLHIDDLIMDYERCRRSPTELADFITKQLNRFSMPPESLYVDLDTIRRNDRAPMDAPLLAPAYGGFDLSKSEDITAAALCVKLADGRTGIVQHSFMPEAKAKRGNGRETKDWAHFVKAGWLTILPGYYVKYDAIREWFREQRNRYDILAIGYDPYNAPDLVKALTADGFLCREVRQGPLTFNAPMKMYKQELLDGNVCWDHDEMYSWYLRNVRLRADFFSLEKENWYPVKRAGHRKNATAKIDGFMAGMNAYILRKEDEVVQGEGWGESRIIGASLWT